MFTGIIEATGTIKAIHSKQGDSEIVFDCSALNMDDVSIGDSISVNGVCLTVITFSKSQFTADVSNETINKSCFGHAKARSPVNFEKAMRADARLGGHIVSGHVDAVGKVVSKQMDARSWRFELRAPKSIAHYIAKKGSITIDGTSLTVNHVQDEGQYTHFDVNIVPHTITSTIMDSYKLGTQVNLEVDLIARYLERLIKYNETENSNDTLVKEESLTKEKLLQSGFGNIAQE